MNHLKSIFFFSLFILTSTFVLAQESSKKGHFWTSRDFGQYFIADRYAPYLKIGVGMTFVHSEYDVSDQGRDHFIAAEPVVGGQIPIYFYDDGTNKFSVSMPVSFSVWFDFLEERTAPILNTDYRYALVEFNYSRRLSNSFIKNIGIKFIPFFHESTHLGDELALMRVRDTIPTTRVNVSYESLELAFLINDVYGATEKNHALRLGAKFVLEPDKGYYHIDPLEVTPFFTVDRSERWIEPYVQYQYQNPDAFLSTERMMFLFSLDCNLRVSYGYPYFNCYDGVRHEVLNEEKYVLSTNMMVGYKFLKDTGEASKVGAYINAYYGINPHGQFRTIPRYPWIGLVCVYEL